ncbi:BACON domain-containing protein [Streptomyces peucetius]|uniref:BACON domain-containing protein n=1 Tax=Streptomyces peucetius TaxID=1950 RepID=A0ABY6IBQ2_STRPE|nr:hypothetical protein [Streptomyces peucetius]UYQ63630.1 hypothetical protein OGH68_20645 [Streptomyces peucetius]
MTSSRLEPPTHTTGAHRAHRRAPRTNPGRPPTRYEPYLDGLFTYCLSVLCDHDAATAVLGDVLAIAERQHGRCPAGTAERKAWMYALARWACLRRLTEQRRRRQGAHTGRPAAPAEPAPRAAPETAQRRRAELARLAWPEAAGTTPEQREALELAVRHGLTAGQVAAVLGAEPAATRELLAAAACEVERTRAALAVVETGNCPAVGRLTGDNRVLLSSALRQELVRHVDDCPRCRRAAERAGAGGPWPGSAVTPATLPLVEAPRSAAYLAMLQVPRARAGGPRFGPGGFPLDPKDHAARRDRLRARAVTTTVVATVVAAPVLALWAAYRGAPLTGEARGPSASADERADGGSAADPYDHYENAGNASATPDPRFSANRRSPDVSVEVVSTDGLVSPSTPGQNGPGRITVEAEPAGDSTRITLRASGGAPVSWAAWTDASWLHLSQSSGTLDPGETITLYVIVDHSREPAGPWVARVGVDPSRAVVSIRGHGNAATTPPSSSPAPDPDPTPPSSPPPSSSDPDPDPTPPSSPPPSSSDPSPSPSDPTPPSDPATPPSD